MGDTKNSIDQDNGPFAAASDGPAADEQTAGPAPSGTPEQQGAADQAGEQSLEDIQLLLEDARAKVDEHQNDLLRARAELDNLRKRAVRDVENARKFALEGFVKELLSVKDSLELGLSAAKEAEGGHAQVIEGIELTLKQLGTVLEKFHVTEVDPVGEPFNPEWHQAMATQPSDSVEPNRVLTVYQKGYLLHDRLVRPAMVVVSSA